MKDLQHLYYFEKLLEEVNNDLVRKAQEKGDIAIGAVCFQIPEPLLNLPGCFSVRLRAPRTGSRGGQGRKEPAGGRKLGTGARGDEAF